MAQTFPKDDMQKTKDSAAHEVRRASSEAKETFSDAKSGVARTVSDAADLAQKESDKRVRAAAGRGADEVDRTASAAQEASAEFPDGSLPHEALSRVSGFLEDTARGLRDTDLEQVTGEVRRFARRNPLAFVAGAAVVGFAAGRLIRASDRDSEWSDDGSSDDEYGSPRGTAFGSDPQEGWDASGPAPRSQAPRPEDQSPPATPASPAVGGRQA